MSARADIAKQLKIHLSGLHGLPRSFAATEVADDIKAEAPAIESLAYEASNCRKCRLCETRKSVVFGVGNTTRPPIAFVGEGPGADEDRQGEPFVGRAGALLTAAITKGLNLRREDVYICNVVKCRPPENRTPLPDEVIRRIRLAFRASGRQLRKNKTGQYPTLNAITRFFNYLICGQKSGTRRASRDLLVKMGLPKKTKELDSILSVLTQHGILHKGGYLSGQKSRQWILDRSVVSAIKTARPCDGIRSRPDI